jgi:hypothetical protein
MLAAEQIETSETWNRLESSAQWAALNPAQKLWVTQFLATGNTLAATKAAYSPKNEKQAVSLSYEKAKTPGIVAAIDVAVGKVKTERDEFIEEVRAQLKSAPKGSEAAAAFTAQLERLLNMQDPA